MRPYYIVICGMSGCIPFFTLSKKNHDFPGGGGVVTEHKIVYFYFYTTHVVELLNYYTNHCTFIKFIKFTH